MMPFDLVFPDVARKEARYILAESGDMLPAGTYVFREFYCADPKCDCRRVLFHVIWVEGDAVAASISYAFEPPEGPFADEGQVYLDPLNPQTRSSDALLAMFEEIITFDPDYHELLVDHYDMWKRVVVDETHPLHGKLRQPRQVDLNFNPLAPDRRPIKRAAAKIGRNAPCPCGSGLKFKRCCKVLNPG